MGYVPQLPTRHLADMHWSGMTQLDDHDTMLFEPDGWVGSRKEGRYDGYLWSHGLDYHWALRDFFTLSGRAPVPPRYSLGIWFTRFRQ